MAPGDALTTHVRPRQGDVIRFDATDGAGDVVLKDGLAELASAGGGT
jgi:hypothetical protein